MNLTAARIDLGAGVIVCECLKKRRKGVFRAIPVPPEFLQSLADAYNLRTLGDARLWSWSRTTAWRRVCEVMEAAGIEGAHATPKGLRHGFAIAAVMSEVPLNMIQRWMGHSRLEITSIYADAVGPEERRIAARMWGANHEARASQPCGRITFPANACWGPVWTQPPPCAQFIAFCT